MTHDTSPQSNYDETFFDYTSQVSRKSANVIIPILCTLLPKVKSVADFGAAQGVWLSVWKENGIDDIQGIDGDYVDLNALFIPRERFKAADLNNHIDLGRHFDLVYSLEVAEHIKTENSVNFVNSLTSHSRLVLFSAAPPGQGGETHINEQSMDFWRKLFAAKNYIAFDCLRPLISQEKEVAFWYRYNTILYVHESIASELTDTLLNTKIATNENIRDVSPLWFQCRKFIVRLMPIYVQNLLARLKATIVR